MAQVLAGLLGITLAEVGKAIGLAVISAGTTKIFNLITDDGSDPGAEVKAKLDKISADLQQVNESIRDLNKNIADMRLGIKTDLVQTYINDIDALYDQYMAALQALTRAVISPDSQQNRADVQRERRRVAELGHLVANQIYKNVEQMHVFLAGQEKLSLLYLANLQSIRDSKDFIAHFVKMKTLLIAMYVPQQKALELLGYALADPKNPSEKVPINFAWGGKSGIHSGNAYTVYYFIDDSASAKWTLEPVDKIDPTKTDVENAFQLRETQWDMTMDMTGSQYLVVRSPFKDGRWFLQSSEAGLFRIRYLSNYSGDAWARWVLKAMQFPERLSLWAEKDLPDTDPTTLFKIEIL
ncbi:hypothetical protein F66182_7659 [Fusarium sp. NRRL 66182]|nr:hypothetical protein F66182_7659 [Fusarium sp. NRRL 66182]